MSDNLSRLCDMAMEYMQEVKYLKNNGYGVEMFKFNDSLLTKINTANASREKWDYKIYK
jgi:hypothetical protein